MAGNKILYIIIILLLIAALGAEFYIKEHYTKVGYNQGAQDASFAIANKILSDLQQYGGTALSIDGKQIVLQVTKVQNSTEVAK